MCLLSCPGNETIALLECPVVERQEPAPGFCLLTLRAPSLAARADPGQFLMLYLPGPRGTAMLPRPFSIYAVNEAKEEVSILFALRGAGTTMAAAARPGENWRVLGPLGRAFPPAPPGALLVAGGMGIAPLVFLAARGGDTPLTMLYCARSAGELICPPAALHRPGLRLVEGTDDGSRGSCGTALELLPELLPGASALYACGPWPMLAGIAALARERMIPAWVSLEEQMACGIGSCLGCVVETKSGYQRVCHDGPVFPAGEVVFHE